MELLRQEPPSQRDSGVARRVLESFDECPHVFVIELLKVVDDECLVSEADMLDGLVASLVG